MLLYLIQHGEAKSEQDDPERPLTERGRRDVEAVAAFLARGRAVTVSRVLHSGKTRARQTAELLAERFGAGARAEQTDGLAPLDDPAVWAARLAGGRDDVMLVGHLPHLAKLAALLLAGDEERQIVKFRMGGVVCLERGETGMWAVQWMVTPALVASAKR